MIVDDPTREVPQSWPNSAIQELFYHARELGQNGNPSGWLLTVEWREWVGRKGRSGDVWAIHYPHRWNYDAIRAWIQANPDRVRRVWQLTVRSDRF